MASLLRPSPVYNYVGAALCSGVIALVMAAAARIHPRLDLLMRLITDAMLAMPHLLLLILSVLRSAAVKRCHCGRSVNALGPVWRWILRADASG